MGPPNPPFWSGHHKAFHTLVFSLLFFVFVFLYKNQSWSRKKNPTVNFQDQTEVRKVGAGVSEGWVCGHSGHPLKEATRRGMKRA